MILAMLMTFSLPQKKQVIATWNGEHVYRYGQDFQPASEKTGDCDLIRLRLVG